MNKRVAGVVSLVVATILWGSSFSFIKLSVTDVSPLTYSSLRSFIAVILLTPIILLKMYRGVLSINSLYKGFIVGIAYFLGLFLQAAGTVYTTPSLSAFITGLNSVHVHLYIALVERNYGLIDGIALLLALSGLYVLTSPSGGLTIGVLLIFMGSIAWAAQIILVSRYGSSSIIEILYGMFLPGALTYPFALILGGAVGIEALIYITYLAVACSVLATFFQVWGQRYVSPLTAALIFLLEPVFALIFSLAMGLEGIEPYKVIGGGLIVIATYLSSMAELSSNWSK
ncbi:DMT family transporter [Desulfurococcus amylolyticus]|uniref:DMT family transporter n=1 Tax=Desulfurococcus amylolyticus TaxID=94694 RepID=UPI0005B2112A|nr:DMT family transporter [Desulfurococcus amylolyticus]